MFTFIKSLFSDDTSISPPDSNPFCPSVNVDGTPMMGDIDIHGHPFGVTDFDVSIIHSCSDDIFNNSSSIGDGHHSMFDDTFNSCGSSMLDD